MPEEVEEITKTPITESVKKEKDPKKVAAGKKLAEYNRRAKEALKEKMKREAEKIPEEEENWDTENSSQQWIPELSFTTLISLVGIGFTVLNMFMSHRKGTPSEPPQVSLPDPSPPRPQPSKIPVPKIGMI